MTKTKKQKDNKSRNIVLSERVTVQYTSEYPHKEEEAFDAWHLKWKVEVQIISEEYISNEDYDETEIDILCTKDAAQDLPEGVSYGSNWVTTGISTVSRENREFDMKFAEEQEAELTAYFEHEYKDQNELKTPLKLYDKNGKKFEGK